MLNRLQVSLGGVVSAFVLAFAIAAPVSAALCNMQGYAGQNCPQAMQGGMQGADNCPYHRGQPGGGLEPGQIGGKALGVMISNLSNEALDEKGLAYGVEVKNVQADSAAAAAGIQVGDLIVEFAGKPVTSAERLRWLVRKSDAGKSIEIKLMRAGKPMTLNATLQEPVAKTKANRSETKVNGA
jgi:S1-C subfamily serine protease